MNHNLDPNGPLISCLRRYVSSDSRMRGGSEMSSQTNGVPVGKKATLSESGRTHTQNIQ